MKTITCRYRLRGRKEVQTIYLFGHYNNQKVTLSTGLKVKSEDWNDRREEVKNTDPRFKDKRQLLHDLQTYLEDPHSGLAESFQEREGMYPSAAEVKEEVNKWLKRYGVKEESKEKKTFWDHFSEFVEGRESGEERKDDGSKFSENVVKNYKVGMKHLRAYKEHTTFRAITHEYHKGFQDYLFNQGMKVNSVARVVVTLKTFMAWAYVKKLHDNVDYQHFKVRNEEVDTVYCNEQKLSQLSRLELSGKLDNARDWFLIGCWTGLRVSDLMRLNTDMIKDGQIHIETKKTRQRVIINLHEDVKAILKKRNGFPRRVSDQHFNKDVKLVCKEAGFDDKVEVKNSAGGGRKVESKLFWELVSSHTCRRSCATNMYLGGVPVLDIMKVTGHKTEKAFFRYIKVTLEETANRLKDHSFYQGQAKLRVA